MSQFYTGYKNPIGTGEYYEGLKLSMNCFKKKTRAKIDMLLGIITDQAEIDTPIKPFIQAEINRLNFGGETMQQTMDRMLAEKRSLFEICNELHEINNTIYKRELH